MTLVENEFLCHEGDINHTLFVVKSGELEGTSTKHPDKKIYGPGSLIGEFCLLEGAPCQRTIQALEDSEIMVIGQEALQNVLQEEPSWLKSIVTFLAGRFHLAQENKRKSNLVKSLPSLLYLLDSHFKKTQKASISIEETRNKLNNLFNIVDDEIMELLQSLQNLDVLKIHGSEIHVESPRVIGMLYDSIMFRALNKQVSPNILTMTEQVVLSTVTKAVQESHEPLRNGTCIVSTESMRSIAKKDMHGMTLTMRTLQPLIDRGLISADMPAVTPEESDPLDSIPFFHGDFEKILDLMELNRIYPLLDKKLVGND
ncbi:MAG: cyclic nucleotide-binding domain-containing protein [Fibrobacter sp.]|nr:cyclic nucleotide-binding domain-containing protein [Fibrobacter sp.]